MFIIVNLFEVEPFMCVLVGRVLNQGEVEFELFPALNCGWVEFGYEFYPKVVEHFYRYHS